jgi:antitoxin (DNA-binding transcriptional repressor) of toxin-antitoxin stability system
MITLNLNQVKTHLSECIARAEAGETVVICKRNKPVAEIRAIPQPQKKPRPVGLLKGRFSVPDSFFEPLPEEIITAFEGLGS